MLKKALLVVGVVVVGGAFLRGSKIYSYVRNEVVNIGGWVEDQVPVEKEIARLRGEVSKLDQDIAPIKDDLAKELFAAEKLQKESADLRARVETEKKDLLARVATIREAGDATHVSIGASRFPLAQARERLASDTKLHELRKQALSRKEESMQIAERNVSVLQKQLAELHRQKSELKVEIDAIDADHKALQLQQMESKYQRDDSRLSGVKESIQKLRDKIAVQQKRVELDKADAPSATPAPVESLDDIEARLAK